MTASAALYGLIAQRLRPPSGLGRLISMSGSAMAACLLAMAAPGIASSPIEPIGITNVTIVSDAELATMRGRFIEGGVERHFGIQMFTAWQTPDGLVLTTGLEWSAGSSGSTQAPTVRFYHSQPQETPPDGPAPTPLPQTANTGGLETARGIVQSVQAAGDINDIGNDIRFNVTDGQAAISFARPPEPLGEPVPLLGTTTVELTSDTKVTAFVESRAIGFVVKVNKQGTVLQELRGDGLGRAAQHAKIAGHFNVIRNTMNINFRMVPADAQSRLNVRALLSLTRDLPQ